MTRASQGDDGGLGRAAGVRDLLRLLAALAIGRLRRPVRFDPGRTVCRWARRTVARTGQDDVRVRIGRHTFLLVASGERSARVLEASPAAGACPAGNLKRDAMAFLAPRALTIAHGDDWVRRRVFNERVLDFDESHPSAASVLDTTRAAFARPVRSRKDVRRAMGRAMLGIVVGESGAADAGLPRDVNALFGAVQSPVRRRLLGFHYRSRRRRLYATLADRWAAADASESSLLGAARRAAFAGDRDELLEQVPHWMFTFTGSGTDLLSRALTLITSRRAVHDRLLEELAAAGPADRAETVGRLTYAHACVLEAGRLFPPVTRTFHRGRDGGVDTEIIHYFPLLQRDDALGPSVHEFRPEHWLGDRPDADEPSGAGADPAAEASNLFLRGPRACPGRDLILFVCVAAIARQLGEIGMETRDTRLSRDPLPVSFPEREARFQPGRVS